MKYDAPLLPNQIFHVFNHAVGDENLFREGDNYRHFLRLLTNHICPVAELYAYNLLPNHFHLLLQIKDIPNLERAYLLRKKQPPPPNILWEEYVMQQFSNACNAYAKAYNLRFRRKGGLFIDYLKRSLIDDAFYFKNVMHYIHYNELHHGFCEKIEDSRWTSYNSLLDVRPTRLNREVIMKYFGDPAYFISFQGKPPILLDDPTLEFGHYPELAQRIRLNM